MILQCMDDAKSSPPAADEMATTAEAYMKDIPAPEAGSIPGDPRSSAAWWKDRPKEKVAKEEASPVAKGPHGLYKHKHHRETAAEIAVEIMKGKEHRAKGFRKVPTPDPVPSRYIPGYLTLSRFCSFRRGTKSILPS